MTPAAAAGLPGPYRLQALALPAAWAALPGAGAALCCEGDPEADDFERLGVPLHESLAAAGPKRRREYLAGRVAAVAALRALGHAGPQPPAPGPDRLPQWPAGLHGSISHSGDAALCWVLPAEAGGAGVGVDVEALLAPERCKRLWRRIAPELVPGQGAAAGHADELLLTLAFSAKESLFKALYPAVRRYVGFEAARVERLAPDGGSLQLVLACDWSAEWPAGRRFTAQCAFDPAAARVMTLLQLPSVK